MPRTMIALAALLAIGAAPAPAPAPAVRHVEARLDTGNVWAADIPAQWNGTVLLFSHGFSAGPANPPRDRPHEGAEALLASGYALLGSSYRETGWAVEKAVPDQIDALDAFARAVGKPRRVIAYGESMGGLVTAALVERHPDRIDGAMPMCASLSGTLGMENQALDGAWALRTLVDPGAPLRIVGVWHPGAPQPPIREEGPAVDALLAKATATPAGRARLALAAVFAQLPDRPDAKAPPAGSSDLDGRVDAYARWFAMGVFFPRFEQERRAGGNASWNIDVDYAAQLAASGKRAMVEALYRRAGLSLAADLATLAKAPRIAADPKAVAYMRANFVPTGKLLRPVLTLHTIGDGATMVTYEQAYQDIVRRAASGQMLRQVYVQATGHCTFNAAETVAAITVLDRRISTGRWDDAALLASSLNRSAGPTARFAAYRPARFLRPCGAVEHTCAGEPASETDVQDTRERVH
ncbi:alpha/beta hydrolase family protein [Sphingomonas sp. BAUL-RG-20F-R05-02]|uniref:alpha/beta hydrolase family protein n=1 Tax=Sphingomonas sp. BAUL-RG-20F-R05-02 TaxID=2914830 RepID=UPI001F5AD6E8|nr:alpha/beta fold hydrolase [Sphingomonas sp. BAUL-RG-20F-R05-02]